MSDMFISAAYSLSTLKTLDLSGWDVSNVTNMRGMFYNCNSLTSLNLSGWNTSNVTNMYQMFWCCYTLTSLDLSHFNTSNVTNMSRMFARSKLTTLNLSGWNTSNVTDMSWMFDGCSNLKTIKMVGCNEETINKIKAQLATDGITGCTIVTE